MTTTTSRPVFICLFSQQNSEAGNSRRRWIFYDRSGARPIQDILLFNGSRLKQFVFVNPTYPDPFSSGVSLSTQPVSMVRLEPNIRIPYLFSAVSVSNVSYRNQRRWRSRIWALVVSLNFVHAIQRAITDLFLKTDLIARLECCARLNLKDEGLRIRSKSLCEAV